MQEIWGHAPQQATPMTLWYFCTCVGQ